MSETTTTTETPPEADKELNFRRLEEERDRFKAEADELRPFRDRETVRRAGFDPDSGEGKSLIRDLGSGVVKVEDGQELPTVLAGYAEAEYGWKPTADLSPTEAKAASSAQRQADLSRVSSSVPAKTVADVISEAETNGNHQLARYWKTRIATGDVTADGPAG